MGYQLSAYSAKEIQELISSEKVMPSLFWVIPIGQDWNWDELDSIYRIFNDINNAHPYRLLGNYFVKNEDPNGDKKYNTKSKLVSASDSNEISKLLDGYINKKGKSLLILSSIFPQPGWGLIVDVDNIFNILDKLNNVLLNGKFTSIIEASNVIYPSYLNYNKLRNSIPIEPTKGKIEIYETCYKYISTLIEAPFNLEVIQSILRIAHDINNEFSNLFKFYESYCIIYNKKDLAKEVILKYRECIELNRYNDFNNKIEKNLLQVFNSFRFIPKSEIKSLLTDFDKWIMEANQQFRSMLIEQLIQIDKNIYDLNKEYKRAKSDFKEHKKNWQSLYLTQNPSHRKVVDDFIVNVIEYSPIFLIELEKEFRNESKICVWDHARMIGWKISLSISNPPFLKSYAKYLNKHFNTNIEIEDIESNEFLNGDSFTDYLHYLFLQDNSKYGDKRKLAEMMLDFFRSDELEQISEELGFHHDLNNDYSNFLESLGWVKPDHIEYDTSLVSFFEKVDGNYVLSNPKIETWNSLRISLESYFKDLIKIITSNLPDSKNDLYDLVLLKINDFRFQSRNNWDREIENITVGPANKIIYALGSHWKAEFDWKEFYNLINRISDIINKPSHHNKIIRTEDVIANELNPLFNKFFILTKNIFKIMPWHFKPISNFWTNPAVYSGRAWSHDHYDKKEIKILVWESETRIELNTEILVWNPSKINPVMTKYLILS